MENSNPILDELKEISPFVAAIGHGATYTVPQGYFESLPVQLMLRIAMEEKAGADPQLNISKANVFETPQGYFEELAGNIMNRIKAQSTEKEAAEPVLNINKDHVFQVPQGYFDGLAVSIMNRIKAEETENPKEELELLSPLLGQIGKKNPFSAPGDYFNDISENIVAGVKAIDFVNEELENLSPVMLGLKNKQVYEVPEGYFETTAARILDKAKNKQSAKVISIGFGKKMMRYAAAAVVAGIIAISGYVISNKPAKQHDPGTIAYNPEKPKPALDSEAVAKISDKEIETFLNSNTVSYADVASVEDNTMNAGDIKDLLADISDEELQHYLDQNGTNPISITN